MRCYDPASQNPRANSWTQLRRGSRASLHGRPSLLVRRDLVHQDSRTTPSVGEPLPIVRASRVPDGDLANRTLRTGHLPFGGSCRFGPFHLVCAHERRGRGRGLNPAVSMSASPHARLQDPLQPKVGKSERSLAPGSLTDTGLGGRCPPKIRHGTKHGSFRTLSPVVSSIPERRGQPLCGPWAAIIRKQGALSTYVPVGFCSLPGQRPLVVGSMGPLFLVSEQITLSPESKTVNES